MIGIGTRPEVMAESDPLPSEATDGWRGVDLQRLDATVERPYWIALSLLPGIGPVGFARLLARFGSAQAAWRAGAALLDVLPRQAPDAPLALKRLARRGAVAGAGLFARLGDDLDGRGERGAQSPARVALVTRPELPG